MAEDSTERLITILAAAPVVPVLIVEDVAVAVPLARALVEGGLTALEITLRTPAALDCIKAIAENVPGARVGAGTILDAKQFQAAIRAGAQFAVSPGCPPLLVKALSGAPIPFLPGCSTVSEAMRVAAHGYRILKFFPAEPAGGVPFLKALMSPLPFLSFCPTGGIGPDNAGKYLALKNVICVGGSWVAPPEAIAARDWKKITELARDAAALRGVPAAPVRA
jgi:2-dehydro-3-deoxyphosphogluconate aldolase / (4S)-4-hydroxy-2-oxoglutarate aldolase